MSFGPPYPPWTAVIGGFPNVQVDVPICTIFAVLYAVAGLSHFFLFLYNLRRHHIFIPSNAVAGFCLLRFITNILRLVCVKEKTNISLALTAQIFLAAGIIVLYIINLIFAQRILRASHPRLGWCTPLSILFKIIYILSFLTVVMVITAIVQSFYTLNQNTRRIDRDIQLYGATYFLTVSFLPLVIGSYIAIMALMRDWSSLYSENNIDQFGAGSFRAKLIIVLVSSCLLCLSASFRAGTLWKKPRGVFDPAWYSKKPAFYCFYFVIEIIVVYFYLAVRVDKRFHIPSGSSKAKHYRGVGKGSSVSMSDARETESMSEEIIEEVGQEDRKQKNEEVSGVC